MIYCFFFNGSHSAAANMFCCILPDPMVDSSCLLSLPPVERNGEVAEASQRQDLERTRSGTAGLLTGMADRGTVLELLWHVPV